MKRWQAILILAVILLIGAYLRLNNLGLTLIEGDQVRDLEITNSMLDTGTPRLKGVTQDEDSIPTTFGPLMYYLLAIPALLSRNAVFITGFIGLFNIIAILLAFKLGNDFFGNRVGLVSAAFLAVNPWAVYYSRFIWNSNFIPVFAMLFLYSVFAIAVKNNSKYIILAFASLACLLQLHMSCIALIPILLIALVYHYVKSKKLAWLHIAVGMLVALILFSPYMYDNLTNNFESFKSQFMYSSSNTQQALATQLKEAVGIPLVLATNHLGRYMFGYTKVFTQIQGNIFLISTIITALMIVLSTLVCVKNLFRNEKYLLVFLYLIIPIIIFTLFMKNLSPHYFIFLYPIQFILIALTLETRHWRAALVVIVMLLVAQFSYSCIFLYSLDNLGGTTGTYGNTYNTKLAIIEHAQSSTNHLVTYKIRFDYIIKSENINISHATASELDDLENITKPYTLAIDRQSRYGIRFHVTDAETNYFNSLPDKKMFGLIETHNIV